MIQILPLDSNDYWKTGNQQINVALVNYESGNQTTINSPDSIRIYFHSKIVPLFTGCKVDRSC